MSLYYYDQNGAKQANVDAMMAMVPKNGSSQTASIEVIRQVTNATHDWFNNGGGNGHRWFNMTGIRELINSLNISPEGKKGAIKAIAQFRDAFTAKDAWPKEVVDKENTCSFMQIKKRKNTDEEISGIIDNAYDAIGAILFKDLETLAE
ncbi:hypothetical protein [Vibrio crassostreae]|uniref:hypothetical protein n=1 Tax=Vibrio crassostreae TaxID=246167 RepID=UPI001B304859|nr:hypothetical protein [Vibrio crassostreae]